MTKEVTYVCDNCGKTSKKMDGWYTVTYHAIRPHHYMIPAFDEDWTKDFCSRKCMTVCGEVPK